MVRKSLIVTILSSALCAAAFAQTTPSAPSARPTAGGQTASAPNFSAPTKVGVINIQAAIVNTNEGRRDFEALQTKFEPKQAQLKTLSDEVDTLKKQLQTQQDKLNEEERNNRVRDIDAKQKNLQRELEDAQTDFNTQQGEVANRIGTKMMDVVEKYARANGLTVVLDVSNQASNVLWASETVNITPAIVEAYNAASGVAAPPNPPAAKPASTVRHPAPGTSPKK